MQKGRFEPKHLYNIGREYTSGSGAGWERSTGQFAPHIPGDVLRMRYEKKPEITITDSVAFHKELFPDMTAEQYGIASASGYLFNSEDFEADIRSDYYDDDLIGFDVTRKGSAKMTILSEIVSGEEQFVSPDQDAISQWESQNDDTQRPYINDDLIGYPEAQKFITDVLNSTTSNDNGSWVSAISRDHDEGAIFIEDPIAFHKELFPDLNKDQWCVMRAREIDIEDADFVPVLDDNEKIVGFEFDDNGFSEQKISMIVNDIQDPYRSYSNPEAQQRDEQAEREWDEYFR